MFERTIETSVTPHVTIDECLGNLTVRGEAERRITLLVSDRDDEVVWDRGEGETLTLAVPADGTLVCPSGTTLTIKSVLGNLRVEGVKGPVVIGAVHGNATLRAVGSVALEGALGNLSARDVAGRLEGEAAKLATAAAGRYGEAFKNYDRYHAEIHSDGRMPLSLAKQTRTPERIAVIAPMLEQGIRAEAAGVEQLERLAEMA